MGIAHQDILALHAELNGVLGARYRTCASAIEHCFHLADVFLYQDQRVQQRRARNYGSSVLIVMKNRNAHGAAQFFFNHETIRRLDVFQIDAAERRFQHLASANHILWVAGSQL